MASFGPIAPYYDLLMSAVPYAMWESYYELLLTTQDVHPKSFLDVCCGTGTIAEMLARKGFRVAGFDLSEPMIEVAREKAVRKGLEIRYEVADAARIEMGEQFDAAYSFFDSLNYITDPDQARLAVIRVGAHLPTGGSFVFDLNTAYAFEAKLFDQEDLRQMAPIRYQWTGEYDAGTRIIQVAMNFWKGDERLHETHIQRAHSDEEVRAWLEEAGFEQVRCYESYTLDKPRKRSDRLHYCAIKV